MNPTPSCRRDHGDNVASMAWCAQNLISTQVWGLDAASQGKKEVPWMCLECFAAGQTGETCGACGAPRAKANQDVWGFDDPSPAGSPRAPPLPSPAPVLHRVEIKLHGAPLYP